MKPRDEISAYRQETETPKTVFVCLKSTVIMMNDIVLAKSRLLKMLSMHPQLLDNPNV